MGDVLAAVGIGKSNAQKAAEAELAFEKEQARTEAEKARRDAAIRQAERIAKKGQETANIKLGADREEEIVEKVAPKNKVSQSLGLGGLTKKNKKVTGVQL